MARLIHLARALVALTLTVTALGLQPSSTSSGFPYPTLAHPPKVETIYRFPNGTWLENLAIRPDGTILSTLLSSPQLLYTDPKHPSPRTIARFPRPAMVTTGILELGADTFYIATAAISNRNLEYERGASKIYKLCLAGWSPVGGKKPPKPELVASFTESGWLNGITALPQNSNIILAADSGLGVIWRLRLDTGAIDVAANNSAAFVPTGAPPPVGANGVHAGKENYLYVTNRSKLQLSRFRLDMEGSPAGEVEVLEQDAKVDDFSVGPDGGPDVFLTDGPNGAVLSTGGARLGKGPRLPERSTLARTGGPTAVQRGRLPNDRLSLYVSSSWGGMEYNTTGPVPVGGAITKITFNIKE
ncbi:MAG: hypothetical protein M1831_002652 [Alyxoria varia]|nr:MAG: hypothetical protein M1831_002652 [Alyxoria varia]